MIFDDRIVRRLSSLFSEFSERQVQDAVLLFLAHLGIDDPGRLAPRLRARLATIANDLGALDAPPRLLEGIAEAFGAEAARALADAGARIGAAPVAKKEAPKPIEQRTSIVAVLAMAQRS